MLNFRCWSLPVVLFIAASAPLLAQSADGPIKMTPEFPLTFPFAYDQANNMVTVKYPVMMNPTTVLKPGMVMRTLYVIQQDQSTDLNLVHGTDAAAAYSRTNASTSGDPTIPYALAHEIEGYRRTVWNTPTNFQLAMAQFPTTLMHLIYAQKPQSRETDLMDQRFNFFDGMLVGQPNGSSVTVLAVEEESKANEAGIKAGDEILTVGGTPVQHDLITFAGAFASARKSAREMDASSYAISVRSPGQSAPHTVNVAMPPTIKSQLLHGL